VRRGCDSGCTSACQLGPASLCTYLCHIGAFLLSYATFLDIRRKAPTVFVHINIHKDVPRAKRATISKGAGAKSLAWLHTTLRRTSVEREIACAVHILQQHAEPYGSLGLCPSSSHQVRCLRDTRTRQAPDAHADERAILRNLIPDCLSANVLSSSPGLAAAPDAFGLRVAQRPQCQRMPLHRKVEHSI
jgi:hypothetical protein